jgi:hypothetical protein
MSGLGSRSNTLEFDKPSISRRSSIFGLVSRTNSGLDSDKMSHKDPPGSFPRDSTNHRNPENPGAQKAMKGKKNKKKGIPEGHVA